MKHGNKLKPLLWLLMIPAQLGLSLLLLSLAARIDAAWGGAAGSAGHPAPVLTLIASAILFLATLIVIVLSIVLTAKGLKKAA